MTAASTREHPHSKDAVAKDRDPALVIHGHFYQPPREDPWTEEIEGEESAAPFENWNERIHSECYRPNAYSRILGEYGKIRAILSNYTWLSFNFGPTLLSWMERHDPETLGAIVSADEESRVRNHGHGNAIAQAYNHMIMPLADLEDKRTQVIWGLEDFRMRFGREPESMWMPETAVDAETLEVLVRHGMKYVILSPFQAAEIQNADGTWRKVPDGRFDFSAPYWIKTPAGRIAAFFYHPQLSSDISFAHLLRSSETFADRLGQACENTPLTSIATDGEIYGHHEPFADMCLAYTCHQHLSGLSGRLKKKIRVTNYGAVLEERPPTLEARLRPGGTSWSCSHGVERWRADCGCRIDHQNGWNQGWRAPLRAALDALRSELREVFLKEGAKLLKDPWAARNDYIRVILGHFSPDRKAEFAARWFKKGDKQGHAWRLLESQRNAMLMFTSCGWFFDDISGIEPRQLMLYASRAHEALGDLAPHGAEERFVRKLKEAKSNIAEQGDGARIYRAITHPRRTAKLRVLNQAILANFAGVAPHGKVRYDVRFEGEAFWQADSHVAYSGRAAYERLGLAADQTANMGRGTAIVRDIRTEVEKRYGWVGRFKPMPPETLIFDVGPSFRWPGGDPRGRTWEKIRPVVGERKGTVALGVRELFRSEAKLLLAAEMKRVEADLDVLLRGSVAALEPVADLSAALSVSLDPTMNTLLASTANYLWRSHIHHGRFDEARRLEHRMDSIGVAITKTEIAMEFTNELERLARPLRLSGRSSAAFERFLEFLRTAQENGLRLDARVAQEAIYHLLKGEGMAMIGSILSSRNKTTYSELMGLLEAAERLNIDIAYEKTLLEPFESEFADDPELWP